MFKKLTLVARLTILYGLISAAVLCGLGLLVARSTYQHFVDLDLAYLQGKASLIQGALGASLDPMAANDLLKQQMQSYEGFYVAIDSGDQYPLSPSTINFSSLQKASNLAGQAFDWQDEHLLLRGIRVPLPAEKTLLLALDTHHHTHFMDQLRVTLTLYLVLATFLSGFLAWMVARRGLTPLKLMQRQARRIDAQQLDVRMPVQGIPVELSELALGLNLMLERLERDFERLSEFSSDLAHELRTPITNLLTQTQVTLTKNRSVEEYRDILSSNAEEFLRLARMVSDMLYLAKTENGLELPHRESIVLEHEVQALFDFYEAVAEEAGIGLARSGHAVTMGDRLMVRRAMGNLLSNALRHAFRGTTIHIIIIQGTDTLSVTVQNEGLPIDETVLPRVFDRFFRVEKSRSQADHSGTGLGLAITKSIMAAHDGEVHVASDKKTTRFTLLFKNKA